MAPMLLALLALLGEMPRASVAPIELENLVRVSDVIVVGRVVDVRTVPYAIPVAERDHWPHLPAELPIADVRVEAVLKGSTDTVGVLFVAAGSWMCDTTTTVQGETGLYFLHR